MKWDGFTAHSYGRRELSRHRGIAAGTVKKRRELHGATAAVREL